MLEKQFLLYIFTAGFKQFYQDFDTEEESITVATQLKNNKLCEWSEVLNIQSGKIVFQN